MSIRLLDGETINKIAAGEVVERPMAVVKELVENAIDAGANAVTVEVKDGGTSLIRITDNGNGIEKEEVSLAFRRHSTSKIQSADDLTDVRSLGFRGEALASIAAVSQVELITKTARSLTGARYRIEGGREIALEEVGCPEGSTFLIRNLFYNTPARRKFLKAPATEAGYILEVVERFAISHPNISFKFISGGTGKFQTPGNGNGKDVIYHIYGRDVAANLIEVKNHGDGVQIKGYIGKPVISRGNRNHMNYYVNDRYVKSVVVNRAIEDAYKGYHMSHRYPFTAFTLYVDGGLVDVNVHPTKMEVRFQNQEEVYRMVYHTLVNALKDTELIPDVRMVEEPPKKKLEKPLTAPEPFENNRKKEMMRLQEKEAVIESVKETDMPYNPMAEKQQTLFEDTPLREEEPKWRIVGQVFSTYWIMEKGDAIYLLDQHAAHEKILYEGLVESLSKNSFSSQMVQPPVIVTLSMREEEVWKENQGFLKGLGFEVEPFGGREYVVSGVPTEMPYMADGELFLELIDALVDVGNTGTPDAVLEKLASLSCKAAVKGNRRYSLEEANALVLRLFTLENPYHCPHGRPTMIRMDKREIEKRFKRVL